MKKSTLNNLDKLKKAHKTWTAVAKELGITYRYVTLIRQGRRIGKTLDILIRLKVKSLES